MHNEDIADMLKRLNVKTFHTMSIFELKHVKKMPGFTPTFQSRTLQQIMNKSVPVIDDYNYSLYVGALSHLNPNVTNDTSIF